jgi:hypothetical protein
MNKITPATTINHLAQQHDKSIEIHDLKMLDKEVIAKFAEAFVFSLLINCPDERILKKKFAKVGNVEAELMADIENKLSKYKSDERFEFHSEEGLYKKVLEEFKSLIEPFGSINYMKICHEFKDEEVTPDDTMIYKGFYALALHCCPKSQVDEFIKYQCNSFYQDNTGEFLYLQKFIKEEYKNILEIGDKVDLAIDWITLTLEYKKEEIKQTDGHGEITKKQTNTLGKSGIKKNKSNAESTQNNSKNEVELIGYKEVCKLMDITYPTLQRYRDKNIIPYRRVGRKIFYNKQDILDKINSRR